MENEEDNRVTLSNTELHRVTWRMKRKTEYYRVTKSNTEEQRVVLSNTEAHRVT